MGIMQDESGGDQAVTALRLVSDNTYATVEDMAEHLAMPELALRGVRGGAAGSRVRAVHAASTRVETRVDAETGEEYEVEVTIEDGAASGAGPSPNDEPPGGAEWSELVFVSRSPASVTCYDAYGRVRDRSVDWPGLYMRYEDEEGRVEYEPRSARAVDAQADLRYVGAASDPFRVLRWPATTRPGAYVVIAPTRGGKTTFARSLYADHMYGCAERGAPLDFSPASLGFTLGCAFATMMRTKEPVVTDSLRLPALLGTALGAKGVPRDVQALLSQLDFACRYAGVAGVYTINFMVAQLDEASEEQVASSVTGMLRLAVKKEELQIAGKTVQIPMKVRATVAPDMREPFMVKVSVTSSSEVK